MSQESANWCRFAKLMINKGAEVLRTFIQLEILTSIFTDYSTSWRQHMDPKKAQYTSILWKDLHFNLERSDENKPLRILLSTWKRHPNEFPTINEQIDQLKEWKKDIEQKQKNPDSEGVKKILDEWLIDIKLEIQKLNTMNTVISKWNDTFLLHLYNSQRDLFLQVEENEFLNKSGSELISIHQLSNRMLPGWIKVLKRNLHVWKCNCHKVILAFKAECDKLIMSGKHEAQGDKIMVGCLKNFEKDITKINLNLVIDTWCDIWYTDLEDVFRTCDTGDYEQAMSMLRKISSFRDMKIKTFFSQLVSPAKRKKSKRMSKQFLNLIGISRAEHLGKLDLTLLVEVLKESKLVSTQPQYLDEELPDWDTSTGADILRLKSYRNDIVAHIGEAKLSSSDFEMLWGKVKTLLCTIASRCGDKFKTKISKEIDTMKTIPLELRTVEQLRKEYTKWCKKDIQVEFPSHLQEMLKHIDIAKENMRKARTCNECKKTLPTESELAEHMKIHKVYHCDRCYRQCSTEEALKQHMKDHQDPNAMGVAAGAGSGAAVGSILGPPGAVVGAVVGGLIGFLGSRK